MGATGCRGRRALHRPSRSYVLDGSTLGGPNGQDRSFDLAGPSWRASMPADDRAAPNPMALGDASKSLKAKRSEDGREFTQSHLARSGSRVSGHCDKFQAAVPRRLL